MTSNGSLFPEEEVGPYSTGSGSNTSPASAQREKEMDARGATSANRAIMVRAVKKAGITGLIRSDTAELLNADGVPFEPQLASQVLSTLHKKTYEDTADIADRIWSLHEKRENSHVYVAEEFLGGRVGRPYAYTSTSRLGLSDIQIEALEHVVNRAPTSLTAIEQRAAIVEVLTIALRRA